MQKIIREGTVDAGSCRRFFQRQEPLISAARELISKAGECLNLRESGIMMKYAEAARIKAAGAREPLMEFRAARGRKEIDFCLANAIKPMELIKPDWAQKGKFPQFPHGMMINQCNQKEEKAYVRFWMKEIGLDTIIAFANSAAEVSPRQAIEAIEKCAREYKHAGVQAFYYIPECYVLAAMALAYRRFKEMKLRSFAGRALHAMDLARFKSGDPLYIPAYKEVMENAPAAREKAARAKTLYFSEVVRDAESSV